MSKPKPKPKPKPEPVPERLFNVIANRLEDSIDEAETARMWLEKHKPAHWKSTVEQINHGIAALTLAYGRVAVQWRTEERNQ